ncbi:hypothetical protein [Acanthopleuribacter pedis]|uniref:Uncharacterized protein n=1 Tax=Acanthopleuribacter pedis TaxID=442870 RepID=A0A8J7QC64_9BACT|nr:hypothetical protein [Acanthopleuribacter pedis]MBO1323482.1 hypothetical protein [Acanthopleuribacter pedis]
MRVSVVILLALFNCACQKGRGDFRFQSIRFSEESDTGFGHETNLLLSNKESNFFCVYDLLNKVPPRCLLLSERHFGIIEDLTYLSEKKFHSVPSQRKITIITESSTITFIFPSLLNYRYNFEDDYPHKKDIEKLNSAFTLFTEEFEGVTTLSCCEP